MRAVLANAAAVLVIVLVASVALTSPVLAECGKASWYGGSQFHGKKTASGTTYNQHGLTAAHKTMAFGTKLRVSRAGKTVTVTVTDRGPFVRGRSLDLSRGAAAKLGMVDAGVATVCWERVR